MKIGFTILTLSVVLFSVMFIPTMNDAYGLIRDSQPDPVTNFDIDNTSMEISYNFTTNNQCAIKSGTEEIMYGPDVNYLELYNGTAIHEFSGIILTEIPCEGSFDMKLDDFIRSNNNYFSFYEINNGTLVSWSDYLGEVALVYDAHIFYTNQTSFTELFGWTPREGFDTDLFTIVQNALTFYDIDTETLSILNSIDDGSLEDINSNNIWDELEEDSIFVPISISIQPDNSEYYTGQTIQIHCDLVEEFQEGYGYYIHVYDYEYERLHRWFNEPTSFTIPESVENNVLIPACIMIQPLERGGYSTISYVEQVITVSDTPPVTIEELQRQLAEKQQKIDEMTVVLESIQNQMEDISRIMDNIHIVIIDLLAE